jgi:hypothetical protein
MVKSGLDLDHRQHEHDHAHKQRHSCWSHSRSVSADRKRYIQSHAQFWSCVQYCRCLLACQASFGMPLFLSPSHILLMLEGKGYRVRS